MVKDETLLCIKREFSFLKDETKARVVYRADGFHRIDRGTILEFIPYTQHINKFNNVTIVNRNEAENNDSYIQMVVAAIIKCNDKIILLEKQNGDLNHRTTLPQGHVSIDTGKLKSRWKHISLKDMLESELNREINEELNLSFPKKLILWKPRLKYNTMNFDSPEDISYYHYGFIFEYKVPLEYEKWFNTDYITSGEPDKNRVRILNLHDRITEDNSKYPPDSWLSEILEDYYIRED